MVQCRQLACCLDFSLQPCQPDKPFLYKLHSLEYFVAAMENRQVTLLTAHSWLTRCTEWCFTAGSLGVQNGVSQLAHWVYRVVCFTAGSLGVQKWCVSQLAHWVYRSGVFHSWLTGCTEWCVSQLAHWVYRSGVFHSWLTGCTEVVCFTAGSLGVQKWCVSQLAHWVYRSGVFHSWLTGCTEWCVSQLAHWVYRSGVFHSWLTGCTEVVCFSSVASSSFILLDLNFTDLAAVEIHSSTFFLEHFLTASFS
ncbi:hypothetical protein LEMLEM_LOCUS14179 [Lemmus lemmus]